MGVSLKAEEGRKKSTTPHCKHWGLPALLLTEQGTVTHPFTDLHEECTLSLWSSIMVYLASRVVCFNSLRLELTLAWGLQIYLYTTYQRVFLAYILNCSIHRYTDVLLNTLAIYTYSIEKKSIGKHVWKENDEEYAQGHFYTLKQLKFFIIFDSHT